MMNTQKARYILIGLVIGVVLSLSLSPIVAVTQTVTAWMRSDFQFEFDGEMVTLPEEYTVLVYQDRTYVPAKFVAENLGAEVGWDPSALKVILTSPGAEMVEPEEPEDEEPEEEEEKEESNQPSGNYRSLPTTERYRDMDLTVTHVHVSRESDTPATSTRQYYTTVYVELENKGTTPLRLEHTQSTAIVDGKTYSSGDVVTADRDNLWYTDILPDEEYAGFVRFPSVPIDSEKMMLSLDVLTNDRSQEIRTVEFFIDLDL